MYHQTPNYLTPIKNIWYNTKIWLCSKIALFISDNLDVLSELTSLPCEDPNDCKSIESSYCDIEANLCRCKPDYPVTDSKHCYKGKNTNQDRCKCCVFWPVTDDCACADLVKNEAHDKMTPFGKGLQSGIWPEKINLGSGLPGQKWPKFLARVLWFDS